MGAPLEIVRSDYISDGSIPAARLSPCASLRTRPILRYATNSRFSQKRF